MDIKYFRGTTRGYAGNSSREGWTSTTTDPRIAALFALQAKRYGSSVVHYIAHSRELEKLIVEPNVFAAWEKEIVFKESISKFGRFVSFSLPGDVVATILRGMGVNFPVLLERSTMDDWMKRLDAIDAVWMKEFMKRSANGLR